MQQMKITVTELDTLNVVPDVNVKVPQTGRAGQGPSSVVASNTAPLCR